MQIDHTICFIIVPGNPVETAVGVVQYEEAGYYGSTYNDRANLEECRKLVDLINGRLGITREVEDAFLAGSMFGWHVPGAAKAHEYVRERRALAEVEGVEN